MKQLTLEELKALPLGDWVWFVLLDKEYVDCEDGYYRIDFRAKRFQMEEIHLAGAPKHLGIYLEDYGTKWLAYKNKEQAEAIGENDMENGTILRLPCAIEDNVFIIHENEVETTQFVAMTFYEDIGFLHLANNQEIKVWFKDGHYSNGIERFDSDFDFTFDETEARLAERKGGNS